MATKKKDDLQSKINGLGKGIASGVGDYLNSAISGITGGMSNGKSIGETLDEIKSSGNSYRYTPPTLPSYSGTQQSKQQVTMPTSIEDLPTYDSTYMDQLNALARQLTSMNYDDWTKGSQYQALADRYGQNGRLSMQDVLGQVASRTGGLASSYATTAAQQQYNQYMAQLEEVARQMYSQDRNDLIDSANLYRNLANDEYDRYRDRVSDYNAQLAAAQAAARSAYSGTSGTNYSNQFTATTGPTIAKAGNRVSAAGSGVSSFSDIKRTISGRLANGNVESASQLVESVWDNLSAKQKQEIKKMGFNVSD